MKSRYLVASQVQLTKSHQGLKEENIQLIINEVASGDLGYFVQSLLDQIKGTIYYLASTIKTEISPEGETETAHVEPLESDSQALKTNFNLNTPGPKPLQNIKLVGTVEISFSKVTLWIFFLLKSNMLPGRVRLHLESCRVDVEIGAGAQLQPGQLVEAGQHGVGEDVAADQTWAGLPEGHGQTAERT